MGSGAGAGDRSRRGACPLRLQAQAPPAGITGVTNDQSTPIPAAGHDYIHGLSETVNPANGSVSLRIAVPVPRSRGLTLPFHFVYNSSGTAHATASSGGGGCNSCYISAAGWQGDTQPNTEGGWSYGLPGVSDLYSSGAFIPGDTCGLYSNFVFYDPQGNNHALGVAWENCTGKATTNLHVNTGGDPRYTGILTGCPSCSLTIAGANGTVFRLNGGPPGVPEGSGYEYFSWASAEDRNGNQATIAAGSGGGVTETDSAGRTVLSASGFGTSGNTVTVSGLANAYVLDWAAAEAKFDPPSQIVFNDGYCGGMEGPNANPITYNAVSSIELPNGQYYTFQYDPTYGTVSEIQYPTGGWVKYTWGLNDASDSITYEDTYNNQNACGLTYATPAVTERQVSFDGQNVALEQTFSYSTTWDSQTPYIWNSKTTTVTTYDLVRNTSYKTVYTYVPGGTEQQPMSPYPAGAGEIPVESSVAYYGISGQLLRTVYKTWLDPFLMTSQTTELDNGETRETTYAYACTGGSENCTLANSQLMQRDDYDYGPSGSPGALLRQKIYSYASFAASPVGGTVYDAPSEAETLDGAGCLHALTEYSYDQFPVAGTSGVVQHDYSNFPAGYANRANPTTIARWAGAADASCVSPSSPGGSFLDSTYTYDDTGQVFTATNPLDAALGKTTETISYADSYASGSPPRPTNAYPTTITDALGHTRHYSWNYASGEMASSTDENGNQTTYTFDDPLGRLTQVNYPDGGETTYTYNDAAPSPSVTTSREITSGNWLTTVAVQDGMEHAVTSETTSDPGGTDYVTTAYDGLGRVYTVTNPYRSTADPTYGVTTYVYDALGRTVSVTNPDGSVRNTTYTGRATEVADEGNGSENVAHISQVDGLGRMISVCEVDSSAVTVAGGAAPVACGQDIAATGFLTTYGYDALGNLTSVAQSGLNGRQFSYDSLSRLLSASNPESGTVSYNYDAAACGAAAAPGLLTCRTDARGITTAYSYDADSRLTQKAYSDGTPTVELTYDQSSPWNITAANAVGRLTTADTLVNGATQTGEIFGYDAIGRVVMNNQCTPENCGNGNDAVAYGYDLLGDMTSASNGAGVTLSYGYNNAAELATASSSLEDSQHPGTLFSSGVYNAPGDLVSATLGTGETETDAYNGRLRLTARNLTGAAGIDPAPGTGSIAVSGTEQSVQVPSTHSTGSIAISGSEGAHEVIKCPGAPAGSAVPEIGCTYTWYYNAGEVYLTVNGVTPGGYYGENSTAAAVASSLASAVNGDASMPVTAAASGATVAITSKAIGTGVNYSLATSCTYTHTYWVNCSFTGTLSGAAMTGGSDVTDYDSGTVSADINGQTESASYGQGSTDTSVASALAAAINGGSSYATAAASGATVAITAKGTGADTDYSLSASSATSDPSQFSAPSLTGSASGPALTGGVNGVGSGAYSVTGITYAPDGDVTGATDSVNGQWAYEYGPLNRLREACLPNCTSPATALQYVYDRFGNRWQENVLAGSGPSAQLTFDANNHIVGASYDAAGDLLAQGSNSFAYDAEGRIKSANSGAIQYV